MKLRVTVLRKYPNDPPDEEVSEVEVVCMGGLWGAMQWKNFMIDATWVVVSGEYGRVLYTRVDELAYMRSIEPEWPEGYEWKENMMNESPAKIEVIT